MVIFLCGFMGSGKSYLFSRLNQATPQIKSVDLDHEILKRFGQHRESLAELIEDLGWEIFRKLESRLLADYCREKGDTLVALGGGALSHDNLAAIDDAGAVLVWMDTPFEKCWERIEDDPQRPLVKKGKVELRRLYEERLPLYAWAKLRLDEKQQNEIKSFSELKVLAGKAAEN